MILEGININDSTIEKRFLFNSVTTRNATPVAARKIGVKDPVITNKYAAGAINSVIIGSLLTPNALNDKRIMIITINVTSGSDFVKLIIVIAADTLKAEIIPVLQIAVAMATAAMVANTTNVIH